MMRNIITFIKNMSVAKVYLSTFGVFILGFLIIFISPTFTGKTYSYDEAKMNEYQTLSNTIQIALVKKEYNPKKEIMRLDFSLKETTTSYSLSNIEYEITSQYIKGKTPLEVEIIRVNDNYLVVIVKNIKQEFSVLSTVIVPKYIHEELQNNNDLDGKSIKIYVNESEKIINNSLKVKEVEEYENEYISFQQKAITKEIEFNEQEIKTEELAITELNTLIKKLETDMNYQTEEEKFSTNTTINGHKSTINQKENEIEKLNTKIKELKEKIELLNKKKNNA